MRSLPQTSIGEHFATLSDRHGARARASADRHPDDHAVRGDSKTNLKSKTCRT